MAADEALRRARQRSEQASGGLQQYLQRLQQRQQQQQGAAGQPQVVHQAVRITMGPGVEQPGAAVAGQGQPGQRVVIPVGALMQQALLGLQQAQAQQQAAQQQLQQMQQRGAGAGAAAMAAAAPAEGAAAPEGGAADVEAPIAAVAQQFLAAVGLPAEAQQELLAQVGRS